MSARVFFVSSIAMLAAACGGDEPATEQAAAPPRTAAPGPAAVAAKPAPDMARGVMSGKPAAGVDLYYEIGSRPAVGQPVEIELLLTPTVGVDQLESSVTGMDGLRVTSPEPSFTASGLNAGDEVRQVVTVVPDAAGVYYASVLVRTDGETGVQARTFAIPLVVGQVAAAEKAVPGQTDSTGEQVRSLPATESEG